MQRDSSLSSHKRWLILSFRFYAFEFKFIVFSKDLEPLFGKCLSVIEWYFWFFSDLTKTGSPESAFEIIKILLAHKTAVENICLLEVFSDQIWTDKVRRWLLGVLKVYLSKYLLQSVWNFFKVTTSNQVIQGKCDTQQKVPKIDFVCQLLTRKSTFFCCSFHIGKSSSSI